MIRLTIHLPEELARAIRHEAGRRGLSVSQLVREVLSRGLGRDDPAPRRLPFRALGRSGTRRTVRRAEEILRRVWGGACGGRRPGVPFVR